MTEEPHYQPDEAREQFPCKGYVFTRDGMHDGGDVLETPQQLQSWMHFIGRMHMARGLELMVCDNMDYANFHAKDGKLIFPDDDDLRREFNLS